MSYRAIRFEELLSGYVKAGKKIGFEEQRKMQLDTVDIQARHSVPTML